MKLWLEVMQKKSSEEEEGKESPEGRPVSRATFFFFPWALKGWARPVPYGYRITQEKGAWGRVTRVSIQLVVLAVRVTVRTRRVEIHFAAARSLAVGRVAVAVARETTQSKAKQSEEVRTST